MHGLFAYIMNTNTRLPITSELVELYNINWIDHKWHTLNNMIIFVR